MWVRSGGSIKGCGEVQGSSKGVESSGPAPRSPIWAEPLRAARGSHKQVSLGPACPVGGDLPGPLGASRACSWWL